MKMTGGEQQRGANVVVIVVPHRRRRTAPSSPARSVGCKGWIRRATGGGRGYINNNVDYNDQDRLMQAKRRCKGGDDGREVIDVALPIVVDDARA